MNNLNIKFIENPTFFYEAGARYGVGKTVLCDFCKRQNIPSSVGLGYEDFCLPCRYDITESLPKKSLDYDIYDEDSCTRMMSDQFEPDNEDYCTRMMSRQFKNLNEFDSDYATRMMSEQFDEPVIHIRPKDKIQIRNDMLFDYFKSDVSLFPKFHSYVEKGKLYTAEEKEVPYICCNICKDLVNETIGNDEFSLCLLCTNYIVENKSKY